MRKAKTLQTWITVVFTFVCVIFIGPEPSTVLAAESFILIQPPGGTDLGQAILPPPGLYGGVTMIPYSRNDHFYDANGHVLPPEQDIILDSPIIAAGLLYVYPFEVFGGSIASSFVLVATDLDYNLPGDIDGNVTGLADAYADVFYWTKNVGLAGVTAGDLPLSYGLNIGIGLGLRIPTGDYDKSATANLGSNVWTPIPNIAVTYVTGPDMSLGDSTELSARIFYGVPFENPDTGYKTGQIFNMDYSAVQRFGSLRVGVAGSYQMQTTGDTPPSDGSIPDRGKTSFASIGPVVDYTFVEQGINIKGKLQFTFSPKNTVDSTVVILSISKKF
ncbi:transporter [Phyllobacterium sp. YR531]|uniref:SphA family protein n=1 Tax=Phyllobacterium sp. YR531 TaxID=1144343 RepID=UPI00026FC31E|nr:transporter [Phyllobacterium sp. YR531]EJN06815.1 protein involved in meta-pathway of phenol degradation [Phyllobacterium sp. YR531]